MPRVSRTRQALETGTTHARPSESVTLPRATMLGASLLLEDPDIAEACDDQAIKTELVEATGTNEANAKAALAIKIKALKKKYEAKFDCESEYCEDDDSECIFGSGPAGVPDCKRQPDIKIEGTTSKGKKVTITVKGQSVCSQRWFFGCWCTKS